MARKSLFKACKNCKALVNPDDSACPICGSTNFSDDWDGIIIVIDENSEISNIAEVKKPWRYAIIVK